MSRLKTFFIAVCAVAITATAAFAADRPFTLGSVWTVTLVRVKPGMDVTYLRDLAAGWKHVMDEARNQQLIVSYKILDGNLPGRDEWNMMLLVEQKNWAAFDGADGKFDAIAEKMVGPEKAQMESMIKRSDMREIVGVRNFQEINFK
ncbi:MAG TPA: hypothetical protein VGN65_13130 [Casimicrobiaceae bacterium]|jgi:hypothetical protein